MYYCFESQCTVGRHSSSAGERGNHGYVKGKKQPENIAHFISNNEFFFHINFKRLGKRIVVLVENVAERERSFSQGVRSQTTFCSCPKIAILGGESISWAMTCVFLRLMVSPKPWQALLKRFMSFWRSSAEWAVTLAPLGKRRSRRHFIWTLSFLSDLVRR